MLRNLLMGAAAGAVGTVALNIVTYSDMAVRARPGSNVPAMVAGRMAETSGIELAPEGDENTAQNRQSGIGALMGYVVGVAIGALYGLIRPGLRGVPAPAAGVGLGLAAMAGSDVPATALGVTEPREWSASSWASDIVPHFVYGLVTAAAYDLFAND